MYGIILLTAYMTCLSNDKHLLIYFVCVWILRVRYAVLFQ